VVEAHQTRADVDVVHALAEAGAEGQGMEDDVGGPFHDLGPGHGRDDAPCLPNDRVHARHREEGPVEGSWVCGPLFPSPCLCLYLGPSPCPCPCLYLARAPYLPRQGQWQAQTREQELQTTPRASRGHVVCYSHDHALFPVVAGPASSTSPALRRHLVVTPSVGEREDPERAPGLG
jgi:hypothetical protein